MKTRIVFVVSIMVLSGLVLGNSSAWARERSRSGSYKGRKTSGTWEQKTERNKGYFKKDTSWKNEIGTGSRSSERTWDKSSGTGTYSSSTNTASGKTSSRSGKVTKQGIGSVTVDGTRTTAKGKTIDVDKTFTRTGAGSASVQSAYTGPQGNTLGVQKTITKTDEGRTVSGTYTSSIGKSGTFGSDVNRAEGSVQKDQYLTNQDGLTGKREISKTKSGNAITRETTVTDFRGQQREYTESATIDEPVGDYQEPEQDE